MSPHTLAQPRRSRPFWARPLAIVAGVAALWIGISGLLVLGLSQRARHLTFAPAWLAAVPVILTLAGMQVYCLLDLARPDRRVKGRDKRGWAVAILCSVTLGCLAYLTTGREDL